MKRLRDLTQVYSEMKDSDSCRGMIIGFGLGFFWFGFMCGMLRATESLSGVASMILKISYQFFPFIFLIYLSALIFRVVKNIKTKTNHEHYQSK